MIKMLSSVLKPGAPFVLMASFQPLSHNYNGYGQALEAACAGLNKSGITAVLVAPSVGQGRMRDNYVCNDSLTDQLFRIETLDGRTRAIKTQWYSLANCPGTAALIISDPDDAHSESVYTRFREGFYLSIGPRQDVYLTGKEGTGLRSFGDRLGSVAWRINELADSFVVYNCALVALAENLQTGLPGQQILLHLNDHGTALAAFFARQRRIPSVYTCHNPLYDTRISPKVLWKLGIPTGDKIDDYQSLAFLAYQLADQVCTVSPSFAQEMVDEAYWSGIGLYGEGREISRILKTRAEEGKFVGVLNGLPPRFFEGGLVSCDRLGSRTVDQPIVICWGNRLAPEKNPANFFNALAQLRRQSGGNPRIIVVGDENNLVIREMLESSDRYDSPCSDGNLRKALAESHFAVMPSLLEPCGLFAMSAQLMGVLPLLTPTGGLKDIGGCGSGALSPEEAYFNGLLAGEVELGQYGLFFTGTNQGRLEKGMRALFEVIGRNDPEVIKALLTMAVRVQQRAAEEYRPERLAARLITNVYEPVLKRK